MAERIVFGDEGSGGSFLRRAGIFIALVVLALWIGCSSVTRVDAGHVGVRVRLAGESRGVQDSPTVQGWVVFNPLTEQIVQFPTSVQNVVWTASHTEGSPHDDSITFSSKEGASINSDIGIAFHIDPTMAPKLYARFRQPNLAILSNTYIRNAVREAFSETAAQLPVQEVYGSGKNKLVLDVIKKVRDVLLPEGIVLDQLTINGALRLPENVVGSINRALEATQNAIQAENRVRQIKAEAEQAIASATGLADAARLKASGEADGVLIKAKAEARANEILRLSLTPTVLAYRQLEKWDGRLPIYSGAALPIMTIDISKAVEMKEEERKKALDVALAAATPSHPPPGSIPPPTAPAPAPAPAPVPPPAPAQK